MRILQVFRNPVGGLFRHVRDVARGQSELGHDVAILCDSEGGGDFATKLLEQSKQHCKLGISRARIPRSPGFGDWAGAKRVMEKAREVKADVIHGHGAKGGLYARLAGWRLGIPSTYTPHYGSLHYEWSTPAGIAYLATEMVLRRIGSGVCFVCDYERRMFDKKVGLGNTPHVTIFNGLWPEDFKPAVTRPEATDFMSLGEIRTVKGLDILMRALQRIDGASLTMVGDGPQKAEYQALANELGIADRVRFPGSMKAEEAVTMGKIMVLSSLNEAFPYVILETAAASLPLVSTSVGGVPEIAPAAFLCEPGSVDALHAKMLSALNSQSKDNSEALEFTKAVREKCDALEMCRSLVNFYATLKA
jgi:glycosyltransferase involved in cell wall biosynthesis